jgi:uridylate kinase
LALRTFVSGLCSNSAWTKTPRRILLKFGSGILTRPHANALDEKQFRRLTADVAQLVRGGCECIIVSSGAVAGGIRFAAVFQSPMLGLKFQVALPAEMMGSAPNETVRTMAQDEMGNFMATIVPMPPFERQAKS